MRYLLTAVLILSVAKGAFAGTAAPPQSPRNVVTIGMTDSAAGQAHSTITIVATPPSGAKVVSVVIAFGDTRLGPIAKDRAGRFQTSFDTKTVANGSYTFNALGKNAEGKHVWNATTQIEIYNKQAKEPVSPFSASDARVELTISGATFKVGQPIPYEVTVTNVSKQALPYEAANAPLIMPGHVVRVLDSTGKPLPLPHYARLISLLSGGAQLAPGETLTFDGYANQWAVLNKPGTYKVEASWSPRSWSHSFARMPKMTSPQVNIEVVAPTQQDTDNALAEARRQLQAATTRDTKDQAIWLLAYTLDPRSIHDIIHASMDSHEVQESGNALRRFEDQDAVRDDLLKELHDQGPYESLAYLLSWFKVPAAKSFPLLKPWLTKGDAMQRAEAVHALAMTQDKLADPGLRDLIVGLLKDPDPTVRKYGVEVVGRFPNTLDAVMAIAKSDPDHVVRGQTVIVLGGYKNDRAIPLLTEIALESDREMMRLAVGALETIASPASIAALQDFEKNAKGNLKTECELALDRIAKRKAAGTKGK